MDSDIDAEVPQRLKSPSKSPSYRSSPFRSSPIKATARLSSPGNRPSNPNSPHRGPTPPDDSTYSPSINSALYVRSNILSPVSNYSSKSIKDSLDVTKIRSLLSRLQAQLSEEKKTNEELSEQHHLEIKQLKTKYDAKLKQCYSEWNGQAQSKYKEISKKKDGEIAKLYEQINQMTNIEESESISQLIKQIEDLLTKLSNGEEQDTVRINNLVTLLKAHIKKMQDSQAQSELKLERQKSHINELTTIIRMLDSKLKDQPNSKSEINDGLEQSNATLIDLDVQELLRISSSERMQLEKQIIWLKSIVEKSDGEISKDSTNREEKIKKLEEELRVSQEKEKSFVHKISKLEHQEVPSLISEPKMDKLLKNEDTRGLEGNSESLQEKVTELEKLCKQQQLNYEEALLELETMKKSNLRNSSLEQNDLGINPISSSYDQLSGKVHSNIRSQEDGSQSFSSRVSQMQFNNAQETHINNSSTDSTKSFPFKHTTPAPTNIRVEIQKNNYLIKWTSPIANNTSKSIDTELTGYHIYLDGHFYKFVGVVEPSCVAIPFPSRHQPQTQQRVSIRSVGVNSQSKDGECTILLPNQRSSSSGSYIPTELKATRITSDSARISWLPADSNLPHVVWVNGTKYGNVPSGGYKTDLEGLFPNTLQKISVFPILDRFGDNSLHAANIDFQTLPLFTESSANLSKNPQEDLHPPKDVKLKLGSRSGKFVVKWQCPTTPSSDNLKIIGYSLFISNQCVSSVNGAKVDRLSVSLSDLRGLSPPPYTPKYAGDQPHLTLTIRTVALYTPATAITGPTHHHQHHHQQATEFRITSRDSMPLLRFSGHVAARIAGTAAGAAILLGSQLAFYLSLIETKSADEKYGSQTPNRQRSRTPKYSTGSDFQQSKMSVPKIQITKDSSFSDENSISQQASYNTNPRHQPPPNSQPNPYQSGPISNSIGSDQQPIRNNLPQNRQNKPPMQPQKFVHNQSAPVDSVRFFVSLYDYDPVTMSPNPDAIHEELPFRAGQTIKVFGQVDEDGFFTGETNGRRGLVPSNMVQEMDGRNIPGDIQGNAGKVFRPIEDSNSVGYGPQSNDDYRRQQGPDNTQMHHSQNDTFNQPPSQYLPKQSSYDVSPNSNQRRPMLTHQQSSSATNPPRNYSGVNPGSMTHPGGVQRKMMTIYDYDPQTLSPNVDSEAELPFRAGEVITIYGEMDEDGFYMGESSINGRRGLVPSNFLTEFTPQMQQQQQHQQPPSLVNQKQPPMKTVAQSQQPITVPQPANQQQQQQMRMRDNRDRFKTNSNNESITSTNIGMNHHHPPTQVSASSSSLARNNMDYGVSNGMSQQHVPNTQQGMMNHQPQQQPHQQRGPMTGVGLGGQNSMDMQKPTSSFDSSFDSGSMGGGPGPSSRNPGVNRPHTNQYGDSSSTNMTLGQGMGPHTGTMQPDKQHHQQQPPPQLSTMVQQPAHNNAPRHNNETDDMPIVMDLAPPSHNQKKKKYSQSNSSSTYDSNSNYMSDSNSFQLNPDNLMHSSEHLERKRSVFKNPFKKKK